jgi:hypothetical protein
MVRILPALVGAVALGAASVLRNKNRSQKRTATVKTKPASAKRTRKAAVRKPARKSRRAGAAKR